MLPRMQMGFGDLCGNRLMSLVLHKGCRVPFLAYRNSVRVFEAMRNKLNTDKGTLALCQYCPKLGEIVWCSINWNNHAGKIDYNLVCSLCRKMVVPKL